MQSQAGRVSGARPSAQLRAAEPANAVVIDASGLTEFDSSALAVLLECRRQALTGGKGFSVRSLPARLRQLAGLYGVAELIPATLETGAAATA